MTKKFTILGLRNFNVKMFNTAVMIIRENMEITDNALKYLLREYGFGEQLGRANVVYHDVDIYITYLNNGIKSALTKTK